LQALFQAAQSFFDEHGPGIVWLMFTRFSGQVSHLQPSVASCEFTLRNSKWFPSAESKEHKEKPAGSGKLNGSPPLGGNLCHACQCEREQ
jgi:hypothetical protein